MILADHPFEPHPNQRYPRACGRCLRIPEVHPTVEVDPQRDRAFEWGCTEAACSGVTDPAALNAFADQRAGAGVIERFRDRDFDLDGLEEAADWRNYAVWSIQQLDDQYARGQVDDETYRQRREARLQALAHVAVAFQWTMKARELGR